MSTSSCKPSLPASLSVAANKHDWPAVMRCSAQAQLAEIWVLWSIPPAWSAWCITEDLGLNR